MIQGQGVFGSGFGVAFFVERPKPTYSVGVSEIRGAFWVFSRASYSVGVHNRSPLFSDPPRHCSIALSPKPY